MIAPEALIWEPATGLGTVPGGATTIPVGLTTEPSDRTLEPAGIELRVALDIRPRVVVVPATRALIIPPDALTWEPATGFFTVPTGAPTMPVGLIIEPFACTVDPGGIEVRRLVDI